MSDERGDLADRVEVLDAGLVGFDRDAEMLLEEHDQLERADGVENAPGDQGCSIRELLGSSPGRNSRRMKCWTTLAISSMMASGDSFIQDEVRENRTFAG